MHVCTGSEWAMVHVCVYYMVILYVLCLSPSTLSQDAQMILAADKQPPYLYCELRSD